MTSNFICKTKFTNFIWNPIECIPKNIEAPILAWTKNDKLILVIFINKVLKTLY